MVEWKWIKQRWILLCVVKWTSVWSVALSSTAINTYVSCPPVGNENGLVGYWNFNEGTGTSTADYLLMVTREVLLVRVLMFIHVL